MIGWKALLHVVRRALEAERAAPSPQAAPGARGPAGSCRCPVRRRARRPAPPRQPRAASGPAAPELLLTPDERHGAPSRGGVEPARGRAFPHRRGRRGPVLDTLQRLLAEVLVLERAARVAMHGPADHDLARRGDRLQARGKVHRFSDGAPPAEAMTTMPVAMPIRTWSRPTTGTSSPQRRPRSRARPGLPAPPRPRARAGSRRRRRCRRPAAGRRTRRTVRRRRCRHPRSGG